MIRKILNIFGIKIFKVGDTVKPNYRVFKDSYLFPNGNKTAKITRIEDWKIYLEDYNGFWVKSELELY